MNQLKPLRLTGATGDRPAGHPPAAAGGIGVLLVNLGTPDATDERSVRRYLREFLSDRRVIELPRAVWWPLLNLVILRRRPKESGSRYDLIWDRERNESPLRTITRSQAAHLGTALARVDPRLRVDWAMRYGHPAIGDRLRSLVAEGCDRVLVAPVYPQYSAPATATVIDKVSETLAGMRWQPAIRTLPPYYDHPAYIAAIARSLAAGLAALDFEPEIVLASYHGMPRSYLEKGDPYYCQCHKTTRLVAETLGWRHDRLRMTFQSRFGRAEWLKPYTIDTVRTLAQQGVKRLAVVMPGFAADCLETLEEIGHDNAETFRIHGGERFAAIPCLNDSEAGMALLEKLVLNELKGWVEARPYG